MSAVLTSKPAFLGILCLVSHMVAYSLGDSLTEPGQIAVTFPELDAAIIEKRDNDEAVLDSASDRDEDVDVIGDDAV